MKESKSNINTETNEFYNNTFKVLILDIDEGFKEYENVKAVNIKSKNYTAMIMLDYAPTVGDVDGSLSVLLSNDEIYYEKIKGFYMINNNEMKILITAKEENNV